MNPKSRYLLLTVLLAIQISLVGVHAEVHGAEGQPVTANGNALGISQLVYENGKLSISVDGSDLAPLLKRISDVTKIPIEMKLRSLMKVTTTFKELTVEDGVSKILEAAGEKYLVAERMKITDKAQGDFKTDKIVIFRKGHRPMTKEEEAATFDRIEKQEEQLMAFIKKMHTEPNKIGKALKEYSDPATDKNKKMQIVTFLRQASPGNEDKPVLRAAMIDPRYKELISHLRMAYLRAIQSNPEEEDKEYVLDLFLKQQQPVGWFIYALPNIWDDRFIPILMDAIRTKPRDIEAMQMIGTIHKEKGVAFKEAIPILEEALQEDAPGVASAAHDALYSLTGKRYETRYWHPGKK